MRRENDPVGGECTELRPAEDGGFWGGCCERRANLVDESHRLLMRKRLQMAPEPPEGLQAVCFSGQRELSGGSGNRPSRARRDERPVEPVPPERLVRVTGIRGGNEKCDRDPMALQDRPGVLGEVPIAVVERDQHRTRFETSLTAAHGA